MVGTNAVLNATTAITRSAVAVIATVFRKLDSKLFPSSPTPPEAYCDCHGKYHSSAAIITHILFMR